MTTVVVIGGGFAGVKCAKSLRQKLNKDSCKIVLFASENHMAFHPLLAEVASASINPKDMAAPLRSLLPGVHVRMEEVCDIDLQGSEISYEGFDVGIEKLKYDQLVIACGNTANLGVIPGMADHAFPMKTVGDALALRLHIINQLERAEICEDSDLKRRILTVIVVGGGFSGVEVAGEIHDFMKRSAKYYSNFRQSDINVTLVHSRDQILPEVSPSLREFAKNKMQLHGVRFMMNAGAAFCTGSGVGLNDGQFVYGATVVCTIGTKPSSIVEELSVPKDRGRILVNADMSIPGFPNAWAVGDCAAVTNAWDSALSPTTGQFAERQGTQVANNIVCRINGQATKPFLHKPLGLLCSIGGKSAVAEVLGFKFSGFAAWFAWRATYLFKLPSITQQIGIGLTWLFGLWFPPALTGLRTDQSKKVGSAHFEKGDWVFKRGEPANEFYVIKGGEVEVVSEQDGQERILAVLGAGDFFGEAALIDKKSHSQSCRARTSAEILIFGKHIFEQISQSLSPLRLAIAEAIKRRQTSWEHDTQLQKVLDQLTLSKLVETVKDELLDHASTLADAIDKMNEGKLDVLYVVDGQQRLEGVVSRTDLMRAVECFSDLPVEQHSTVPVKQFMTLSPIYATERDNTRTVLRTMREHSFKRIPVVSDHQTKTLIGSIRTEKVFATVMHALLGQEHTLTS